MNPWIKTTDELPPEKLVVMTKLEDNGIVRYKEKLRRFNNKWCNGILRVFYKPTHWRMLE